MTVEIELFVQTCVPYHPFLPLLAKEEQGHLSALPPLCPLLAKEGHWWLLILPPLHPLLAKEGIEGWSFGVIKTHYSSRDIVMPSLPVKPTCLSLIRPVSPVAGRPPVHAPPGGQSIPFSPRTP